MTRKDFFVMVASIVTAPLMLKKKKIAKGIDTGVIYCPDIIVEDDDMVFPAIGEWLHIPFLTKDLQISSMAFPTTYKPGIFKNTDYIAIIKRKDVEEMTLRKEL